MIEFPLAEAVGPPLTHTLPYTLRRSMHTGAELGCPKKKKKKKLGFCRELSLSLSVSLHLQRHGQDHLKASLDCPLQEA